MKIPVQDVQDDHMFKMAQRNNDSSDFPTLIAFV
jgi:hypothetical protein